MIYTKLLKYGALGLGGFGAAGTYASLRSNQYNLDSIGIVRFGRASCTALTIVFYYKTSLYGSGKDWDKNSPEYLELRSTTHKKAANKLLELCRLNKGVYIKVGQHIGALDYVLPSEYVETMKVLHSRAPASTIEEVYQVIREDFKKEPDDVFESIDSAPLGAASLAQVHKAKLKDGRMVALKVQHPSVKGNSTVDMKTMEILSKIVSYMLPDFKVQWLVDETKKNIPRELDFELEADNTEKARQMFRHLPWLKIPSVFRDLCSHRVLALEFVEGGQVNDLDYIKQHKINPYEVSDKLGKLYSEMIFKRGFVHSDPHPGNILVKKTPSGEVEIVLLDHGLYATLSDDFRYEYAQLWISILNKDMQEMAIHCTALGVPDLFWLLASMVTGRSWDAIKAGLNTTRFDSSEKELVQREFPNLLTYISDVLSNVNRQMILIFKTNDLLRGIEHTLQTYSRMESFSVITKNCIETIYAERKKQCASSLSRWSVTCGQYWALFRLSMYYNYLRVYSWFFV
ncbi:aarF domain-containing kinase 1 [Planococcus citri]|uniref:aarF domain-containing kinase 1 n=1 Tax=Planococcus citri TaxID=170843 RepID=UPI0031F97A17